MHLQPARPESRTRKKRQIRFRTSLRNTVLTVFEKHRQWVETESEYDWDLHWADIGWIRDHLDASTPLQPHQRINHFQNHYELTRKDLLIKNLKRIKKKLKRSPDLTSRTESEHYNFWLPTYVLPMEYGMFVENFKLHEGTMWIMKPIGRAQGKGIFLFNKLSDIDEWKRDHTWKTDGLQAKTADTYIVQKYVERPYTIGGKKFDLRLYVLVTSFSPLTFWIYRGGFGRFSNSRYTMNQAEIDNLYMHLTNASVQKTAADYDKSIGCKWSLHNIKMHLIRKHGLMIVDKLFQEIQAIVTRSLLSVQHVVIQDRHCFELYGYDVLIDHQLKPWLLEVNASPSLTSDHEHDRELKCSLVNHTLDVIDIEGKLSGEELHIGGFDLIWRNGRRLTSSHYLGCKYTVVVP